jgi:hypothetical protein
VPRTEWAQRFELQRCAGVGGRGGRGGRAGVGGWASCLNALRALTRRASCCFAGARSHAGRRCSLTRRVACTAPKVCTGAVTHRKPPPPTRRKPPPTRRVVRTRTRKPRFDLWFDRLCAVLFTLFGTNTDVHDTLRNGAVTWGALRALFNTHDRRWTLNVLRGEPCFQPEMKAFWLRCVDALCVLLHARPAARARPSSARPHARPPARPPARPLAGSAPGSKSAAVRTALGSLREEVTTHRGITRF